MYTSKAIRCKDYVVPQPLPRAFRRQLESEDREKAARIVRDAETYVGGTAGGDERRLRGIPAVGRGCGGAIGEPTLSPSSSAASRGADFLPVFYPPSMTGAA
jgi:hypothetical protein